MNLLKKILVISLLAVVIVGCGGGGGNVPENYSGKNNVAKGVAQLGYISGGNIAIYKFSDLNKPIVSTKTVVSKDLAKVGRFEIKNIKLNPNEYYLVTVSGGDDVDADDNGVFDTNTTKLKGTVHCIASGNMLKDGISINAYTDMIFEKISKSISTMSNRQIKEFLDTNAQKYLFDINKDDKVDYHDIVKFNPINDKDKTKNSYKDILDLYVYNLHINAKRDRKLASLMYIDNPTIVVENGRLQEVPFLLKAKLANEPKGLKIKWYINGKEKTEINENISDDGIYTIIANLYDGNNFIKAISTSVIATAKKEIASAQATVDKDTKILVDVDSNSSFEGTQIYIPKGALKEDTKIVVKKASVNAVPSDENGISISDVLVLEPSGLKFDKPVQVRMPYDPSLDLNKSNIRIARYSQGGKIDYIAPLYIDKDAHEIVFETEHFTYFKGEKDFIGKSADEKFIDKLNQEFPKYKRSIEEWKDILNIKIDNITVYDYLRIYLESKEMYSIIKNGDSNEKFYSMALRAIYPDILTTTRDFLLWDDIEDGFETIDLVQNIGSSVIKISKKEFYTNLLHLLGVETEAGDVSFYKPTDIARNIIKSVNDSSINYHLKNYFNNRKEFYNKEKDIFNDQYGIVEPDYNYFKKQGILWAVHSFIRRYEAFDIENDSKNAKKLIEQAIKIAKAKGNTLKINNCNISLKNTYVIKNENIKLDIKCNIDTTLKDFSYEINVYEKEKILGTYPFEEYGYYPVYDVKIDKLRNNHYVVNIPATKEGYKTYYIKFRVFKNKYGLDDSTYKELDVTIHNRKISSKIVKLNVNGYLQKDGTSYIVNITPEFDTVAKPPVNIVGIYKGETVGSNFKIFKNDFDRDELSNIPFTISLKEDAKDAYELNDFYTTKDIKSLIEKALKEKEANKPQETLPNPELIASSHNIEVGEKVVFEIKKENIKKVIRRIFGGNIKDISTTTVYKYEVTYNNIGSFTPKINVLLKDGRSISLQTDDIVVTKKKDEAQTTTDTNTEPIIKKKFQYKPIYENSSVSIDKMAYDPDGDSFTIEITHTPSHGKVVENGKYLVYTPKKDYIGMDSFKYIAKDKYGAKSKEALVSIKIIKTKPIFIEQKAVELISTSEPKDTCGGSFWNSGCEAKVYPGDTFIKTWTFKNVGNVDLKNISVMQDISDSKKIVTTMQTSVISTLKVGETGKISIKISIPKNITPGVYKARYKLVDNNGDLNYKSTNGPSYFWYMLNVLPSFPKTITLQNVKNDGGVAGDIFTFSAITSEALDSNYKVMLSLGDNGGGWLAPQEMIAYNNRTKFAKAVKISEAGKNNGLRKYRVAIFYNNEQVSEWIEGTYRVYNKSKVPTNIKVVQTSEGALISWDAVKGAKSYQLYAKFDDRVIQIVGSPSGSEWKSKTSYLLSKSRFKDKKEWYFAVSADNGSMSDFVKFVWKDVPEISLPSLKLLPVKDIYENQKALFKVELSASLNSKYSIKISLGDNGGGWLSAIKMDANQNRTIFQKELTITKAGKNNGLRKYRVAIFEGDKQLSSWVEGSYKVFAKVDAPTNTKIVQQSNGALISWDKVKGATGYKIYTKSGSLVANLDSSKNSYLINKEYFKDKKEWYFAVSANNGVMSQYVKFVWRDSNIDDIYKEYLAGKTLYTVDKNSTTLKWYFTDDLSELIINDGEHTYQLEPNKNGLKVVKENNKYLVIKSVESSYLLLEYAEITDEGVFISHIKTVKLYFKKPNTNVDLESLVVGKTYYQYCTQIKELFSITFNSNGKLIMQGSKETQEVPYKIEGNTLYTTENGKEKAHVLTSYGDNYIWFGTTEDGKFYTNEADARANPVSDCAGNDEGGNDIKITDLVTGHVEFIDKGYVPSDAWIRITPEQYQIDGNWNGLNCKIDSNGNFGKECYINNDEQGVREAFNNSSTKYQIVVYKNHIEPNGHHWNCGEDVYKDVGGNEPKSSWENITVKDEDYQDRSSEECSGRDDKDFDPQGTITYRGENYKIKRAISYMSDMQDNNVQIFLKTYNYGESNDKGSLQFTLSKNKFSDNQDLKTALKNGTLYLRKDDLAEYGLQFWTSNGNPTGVNWRSGSIKLTWLGNDKFAIEQNGAGFAIPSEDPNDNVAYPIYFTKTIVQWTNENHRNDNDNQNSTNLDRVELYQANKTINSNSYVLSWHSVSGSDFYEVEISKDSTFNHDVEHFETSNTSFRFNNLESGYKYYFRVRARTQKDYGEWSIKTWVQIAKKEFPEFDESFQQPADGSIVDIYNFRFGWNVKNDDKFDLEYYVEVGESSNNLVYNSGWIEEKRIYWSDITSKNLKPNTDYYWRVLVREKGKDKTYYGGEYISSPIWKFTTANDGYDLSIKDIELLDEIKPNTQVRVKATIKNNGNKTIKEFYAQLKFKKGSKINEFATQPMKLFKQEIEPGGTTTIELIADFRDEVIEKNGKTYDNVIEEGVPSALIVDLPYSKDEDLNPSDNTKEYNFTYVNKNLPEIKFFSVGPKSFYDDHRLYTSIGKNIGRLDGILFNVVDDIKVTKVTLEYQLYPNDSWHLLKTYTNNDDSTISGDFEWIVPNDTSFVTDEMRIRIRAYESDNSYSEKISYPFPVYNNNLVLDVENIDTQQVGEEFDVHVNAKPSTGAVLRVIEVKISNNNGRSEILYQDVAQGDGSISVPSTLSLRVPSDNRYATDNAKITFRLCDSHNNCKETVKLFEITPKIATDHIFNKTIKIYDDTTYPFPQGSRNNRVDNATYAVFVDKNNKVHVVVNSVAWWVNNGKSDFSSHVRLFEVIYDIANNSKTSPRLIYEHKSIDRQSMEWVRDVFYDQKTNNIYILTKNDEAKEVKVYLDKNLKQTYSFVEDDPRFIYVNFVESRGAIFIKFFLLMQDWSEDYRMVNIDSSEVVDTEDIYHKNFRIHGDMFYSISYASAFKLIDGIRLGDEVFAHDKQDIRVLGNVKSYNSNYIDFIYQGDGLHVIDINGSIGNKTFELDNEDNLLRDDPYMTRINASIYSDGVLYAYKYREDPNRYEYKTKIRYATLSGTILYEFEVGDNFMPIGMNENKVVAVGLNEGASYIMIGDFSKALSQ